MSTQSVCDICERALNIDNINLRYKVKARKHAFDGWSRTFDHDVDVCDMCVEKVNELVNDAPNKDKDK